MIDVHKEFYGLEGGHLDARHGVCEKCGRRWQVGDFPYCRGNPEDHIDPHYTGWMK